MPSVVYGLWGLLVVAPWVRTMVEPAWLTSPVATVRSAARNSGVGLLLAGLILAIMVLPTMVAISRDVCWRCRRSRSKAPSLWGATRWQVMRRVVVPSARRDLGGDDPAIGRALGETIAVTMVIGNTDHFAHSLFGTTQTMASMIANEFTEATEPFHLAALVAVGVVLLVLAVGRQCRCSLLVRSVGRERAIGIGCYVTILDVDPVLARRAEIQRIAQATDHRRELFSRLALIDVGLAWSWAP